VLGPFDAEHGPTSLPSDRRIAEVLVPEQRDAW